MGKIEIMACRIYNNRLGARRFKLEVSLKSFTHVCVDTCNNIALGKRTETHKTFIGPRVQRLFNL